MLGSLPKPVCGIIILRGKCLWPSCLFVKIIKGVADPQQMAKTNSSSKTQNKKMITKYNKSKQVDYGLWTFPASVEEAAAFVPQPLHLLIAAVYRPPSFAEA